MNNFYVYALQDQDGCAFYIGKGKNRRIFEHFCPSQSGQNNCKWNKIQKLRQNGQTKDEMIRYIATDLPEDKALKLEADVINEIGLENLTNAVLGGGQGGRSRGERNGNNTLSKREAAYVKWLANNSVFGHKILYQHYQEHFEDDVTAAHFIHIKQDNAWVWLDAEIPPFVDFHFETLVDRVYNAFGDWRLTDVTAKEAATRYGVITSQLSCVKKKNYRGLADKFEKEYRPITNL